MWFFGRRSHKILKKEMVDVALKVTEQCQDLRMPFKCRPRAFTSRASCPLS